LLFFFTPSGTEDGVALWKSDGSEAGTVRVKDLAADSVSEVVTAGDALFFTIADAWGVNELWKSDGTQAGTTPLPGSGPHDLTPVNEELFFAADDGTGSGMELWKSDGTTAGTGLVADIVPGVDHYTQFDPEYDPPSFSSPYSSDPHALTNVNGTLYFAAAGTRRFRYPDSASGVGDTENYELWKYAPGVGAVMVKDIWPGDTDSFPGSLVDVNGTLYFTAIEPDAGRELWRSDGTEAGTVRVKEIVPGSGGGGHAPSQLVNVNGTLFFTADDGTHSRELWRSDGTEAGTVMIKDADAGALGSFPLELTTVNGTLFFHADVGADGRELWRTDGTEAGTVRVLDLNPGSAGSAPHALTNINGTLYFGADDGSGQKLFKLDTVMRVEGTAARDVIVASVNGTNLEVRINGQVVKSALIAEATLLEIRGGDGDDVIDCSTLSIPVVVNGGNGNDKVAGGSAPDTIGGAAGKDTLDGGLGNDRLNGHGGHDRLFGNAGADRLYGYDGNDLLDGSSSGDRLYGGNGSDTMFGAGGNDRFFAAGDGGIDELFGGSGDDRAIRDASDILASIEIAG
jgi:ELWxxDGT repeat protein